VKPKASQVFFFIQTRRLSVSLEGLNSTLPLVAGDFWPHMCLSRSCIRAYYMQTLNSRPIMSQWYRVFVTFAYMVKTHEVWNHPSRQQHLIGGDRSSPSKYHTKVRIMNLGDLDEISQQVG